MHPYRKPRHRDSAAPADGEELVLYVALCVVGAIPVVVAAARGGAFGVEPTIGLMMAVAGLAGLAGLIAAWIAGRDGRSG